MTVTHGNDPDVLDGIADALGAQADRVETISGTGSSGVAVLVEAWAGPDLEVFGENWRGAQQQLESASQLLRAVGERAREQAQQQRDSSGEGGGGGGGAPWLPGPNADRTLPTPDAPPLNLPLAYGTPPGAGGGDRVPHSDKDQGSLEIPFPPGDEPWVPQGLAYSDEEDVYVHTFYNHDDSGQGMLAIQSADGTSVKYIPIEGNSHYGGAVIDGDNVYVSGNGTSEDSGSYITRYSLEDLLAAEDGRPVDSIGDPVEVETGSTVTVRDGTLYAANFSKGEDDGPARVYEYSIGEDGSVIADDDPPSFRAPEGAQGIVTPDGENFYYTKSNGNDHSDLIHGTKGDNPFVIVDNGLSPLSQGVIIRDGELVVTNESYADEYRGDIEDEDSRFLPNILEKPVGPDKTLQTYDVPSDDEIAERRDHPFGFWRAP